MTRSYEYRKQWLKEHPNYYVRIVIQKFIFQVRRASNNGK